jgi:CheY-like chemotaxis protein
LSTVLVVDDDPNLLELAANILAEPGYTVLTAPDGYQAIRVIADRHVDLMIADLLMPGINGRELASQAKVMRPNLHVIFITGFANGVSDGRVLQKPLRAAELLRAIRQTMSAA